MNLSYEKEMDTEIIPKELKNAKLLVTGASGLIGSVLTEYLLKENAQYQMGVKLILLVRNREDLLSKLGNRIGKENIQIIQLYYSWCKYYSKQYDDRTSSTGYKNQLERNC